MTRPVRTLLAWCPDWPVIAAQIEVGVPAREPVAVLHGNRVVACSPAARAEGVRRGLRRREAQSRCPQLVAVGHDPGRDARAFEPVVAAIEQVVAGVEVVRPGCCAMAVRGAARYFGGEQPAAERIVEQVAQECGVEAQAGIADGVFAAGLAARAGRVVPPGQTPGFLAGVEVGVLDRPELTDRLRRLGIRTLGEFAALPAGDVLTRFGFDAALAHRLAGSTDDRPLTVRRPPAELTATEEFDEPIDRVDVAAFAARSLARRLHDTLAGHGLACTRLGIEAVTTHGQELHRTWRHDGLLTVSAITDRVRWQLEGWLTRSLAGGDPARPAGGGIRWLRLVPDGVLAQAGQQPGLWGEVGEGRSRAHRALARVQGLLGPASVLTAVLRGGRSPADQVRLVPWGEERAPAVTAGGPGIPAAPEPWPGQLPAPAPATVLTEPAPATVQDARGQPVTVSARLAVSAAPAWLRIADDLPARIAGWTGPWPVHERWWAPGEARRRARFQVRLADGRALLLVRSEGRWCVEAWYD
ncbi:MAG: DNA polymerase Y family protein [Micromonosporaceae bacterium]|nr:DNA polymerase Y family protein [Micromonosporaceae bacterium]